MVAIPSGRVLCAGPLATSGKFENDFDFDGCVKGQRGHPHRGTRVRGTEHLGEQVGGPVNHLRVREEVRRGGDESRDLHGAREIVHPAGNPGRCRDRVDLTSPTGCSLFGL